MALSESGAILFYLAEGTSFLPTGRLQKAKVLQWMFFEQHRHEPSLSVARLIHWYQGDPSERLEELVARQENARQALDIMEQTLSTQPFLAGETLTLADIALFAHTHIADQAGLLLLDWPHVVNWCGRIEEIPGFVSMQDIPDDTVPAAII